jgi:hypothetical protein
MPITTKLSNGTWRFWPAQWHTERQKIREKMLLSEDDMLTSIENMVKSPNSRN